MSNLTNPDALPHEHSPNTNAVPSNIAPLVPTVWPRGLRPGHTVGIVAPAGASPVAEIEAGIAALEARSFHVVVGEYARAQASAARPYLADSDAARAADLNAFFRDRQIDAILCTRGGYGSMRLLPLLDYDAFAADPKPLIGYSDITSLSLALAAKSKVTTFSGPMLADGHGFRSAAFDSYSERSFFDAVSVGSFPRTLASPANTAETWNIHRVGDATDDVVSGALFPVCLTLLAHLIGTEFLPNLDGAILMIEDIEEPLYRVDRYLTHLRLAGLLENLVGVLIGSFTHSSDEEAVRLAREVPQLVLEMTPPTVTVASGIAYGHIARRMTLPVGAFAQTNLRDTSFTFG